MIAGLRGAVRFLTRVPMPGPPTGADELIRAVPWFPLVGAAVGAAIAGIAWAAGLLWPPAVAAVLAVGAGLLLTGAFHEDAAADAADGLGGGWTRERVIEIMRDSRIGAYGACALVLLLGLRVAALVHLGAAALWVLPLAMAWGRWTAAPWLAMLPPADRSGLGRDVAGACGPLAVGAAALVPVAGSLGAGWAAGWIPAAAGAAAALLLILGWAWYLRRRIGGQTGDLLGAGNQAVEAAVLLAWLAR